MQNEKVQMQSECKYKKNGYRIFLFILIIACSLQSQVIDTDTSDVVIRRISKEKPSEFNISDVTIKLDKDKTKHILRVNLEIPVTTALKLNVTDSTGAVIMYLINEQTLKSGIFRVKWDMDKCRTDNCDYPPGKYKCSFETDQFIYQIDFYLR